MYKFILDISDLNEYNEDNEKLKHKFSYRSEPVYASVERSKRESTYGNYYGRRTDCKI